MCQKCWIHINDFHDFQIEVLKSRSLLLENDIAESKSEDHDIAAVAEEISDENEFGDMVSEMENDADTVEITIERDFDVHSQYCKEDIQDKSYLHINNPLPEDIGAQVTEKTNRENVKTLVTELEPIKCRKISSRQRNNNRNAVYTLEKGRELDTFIAQWKPNLECDLCPETATSFDSLRTHFREVHNIRFYIKCCDRKFYRRCILVDHIRLHVDPDTHKCEICGKSSTSKYNLKLHKRIVHNENRNFECEICHKTFNHKPTLHRHLLTHVQGNKEFFCKECGKGYVLEVQLNTHMRNVHNGIRICDQCGKTFQSVGALKKHLMEHGIIPQPKFPCDICGAELKSNEALKRHRLAYHHDGSIAYICSICGKVASSEHALLSHKKFVHEDKRKHKCTFCDKAFRTRTVLREHIATHTGEDLYQCPHCTQTFKTNANMHHHRKRVHPDEWKAARKNRLIIPKVDVDKLSRQVVL